jgi:hypothetical protein
MNNVCLAGKFVLWASQRFMPLMAHLRDRPFVLDGSFQPHLRVTPFVGCLEMTPVETLVLGVNTSKPKCHSAQAADVLSRDTLHPLTPGFIRIFNGRCTGCNECFSPLLNDAPLFPIGAANQSFPPAHERLRLAIERLVIRGFILH